MEFYDLLRRREIKCTPEFYGFSLIPNGAAQPSLGIVIEQLDGAWLNLIVQPLNFRTNHLVSPWCWCRISSYGSCFLEDRLECCIRLAESVAALHKAEVIHCDLSDSNVGYKVRSFSPQYPF